jgi:hypothetical protein
MAKQLKEINSNDLGDHLEDYCNEALNKKLRKFLVLDSPSNVEDILDKAGFTDVTNDDVGAGIAVAEATLVEVNRVLKAQGIEFEFKSFDMCEYTTYMLVHTNENLKGTAKRVRELVLKRERKVKLVDASPF